VSRFEGDNPQYAATLVLSMRTQPEGGSVRAPCQPTWAHQHAESQTDLIVLVHGFNNNEGQAQDAYVGFRQRQKAMLGELGDRLEAMLGDAFWPGDADWPGPLDTVDFLVYPATISRAVDTAAALSDYLLTRQDVLNLYFIGHSMGCRVVLETIRLLRANASFTTPIRKVCLMAAAVPTGKVFPGGELEDAFLAPEHVRVLYSPDDPVLHFAFPIGQTAGGDGFFPTAIGRCGDVPLSPGHVDRSLVSGAGHSDYWGWKDDAPSALSAEMLHEFLGIGAQVQMVRESPPPPERAEPPVRPKPRSRAVGHP